VLTSFSEPIRYILNGLLATAVHYGVLLTNVQLFNMQSIGLANLIAALFGITISFIGSRYFVFKNQKELIIRQAVKFGSLYTLIAVFHGLILFIWSDIFNFDFRIGFVIATAFQVFITYFGNRKLVFKA